jgi:hypothetical protein
MIWEGSVSELYQTKLKKLEADKRRLEALTADYDAVTKQFGIADPTVIPRLERGEEAKYEAMETLAKQIDAQERELVIFQQQEQLEALPQALQELINILFSVNFDVIRIAYSACIEGRSREVPSSLVALPDLP